MHYEQPKIIDKGTLRELTAACQGFGGEDGATKDKDPFTSEFPDFSDPGFCGGP